MGYYTYHTVTIENDDGLKQDHLYGMLVDETIYTTADHFAGHESCKWYDCDADMVEVSKRFPDDVIRVDGQGEDSEDRWVKWWKNGVMVGSWKLEVVVPEGFEPPEECRL